MQSNTSKTMFYSLLFAIGGAPTLAMWMIYIQTNGALEQHWTTLLALSFVLDLVCLVSWILISFL